LFDFAVLDLVSSILSHKTGSEECLQNGQFCVNCNIKKVMLSVSQILQKMGAWESLKWKWYKLKHIQVTVSTLLFAL